MHDATPVSTALQTEDRAFESLYRLNRPVIYAYALSRLRNPADAEDVTQTTFLNAYTALHRGVTPRDDIQWLIAIARNACRDRFRDAKRRPAEEPLEDRTPAVQPEAPEYTVDEIAKQISDLHPRQRQIILMREFEGRSYGEISDKLGVSQAAVQALLVRARRTLRDELELGITCAQARRVSLRHLNGAAMRDERRALNRHLRKCNDCATFVGRRPHSLATILLLPTLPFRKLWIFMVGTSSAPVGTTAGGGGAALAVKALALAAIGSTAVGVTVKETAAPPTPSHSPAAPTTRVTRAPVTHPSVRVQSAPTSTWAAFRGPTAGRARLTHAPAHRPQQPTATAPQASASSAPAAVVAPSASVVDLPAAGPPAETSSETPIAPDQPQASRADDTTSGTADEAASVAAPSPAAPSAAPAGAPAAVTPGPATTDSTAASTVTPPPADPAATSGSDAATGTPPAVTPPTPSPPPTPTPGVGNGNANGNGNAGVGRGGTPPGQGGTPPQPAHGRP
jgi:RNA polymerase sigma-70 factor (ECF subfamily)